MFKKIAKVIFCCFGAWVIFLIFGQTKEKKIYTPEVIFSVPHAAPAYTQGFLWDKGSFYESVGLYGLSQVRQLDAATGAIQQNRINNLNEFGEGLALKEDTLVQLTWREGYALRMNLANLNPVLPNWSFAPEGWGLTWMPDENLFIRSNGTSFLYFHNPNDFSFVRTIEVKNDGKSVPFLNELEYAKGKIYANVYGIGRDAQRILEIDPNNGHVTAEIDFKDLCVKEKAGLQREFNGIAYNTEKDLFYVTGKNWQFIYAVRW